LLLPSPAELARTTVARARVAALTTYPRRAPARPHLTSVAVGCSADGCPVVQLASGSRAAAHLLARPLATVRMAPVGGETVTVHGAAHRLAGRDAAGTLAFRVEVGAVRLGAASPTPVGAEAYRRAEPDPLRDEAPAVLEHLRAAHADDLAACLRAMGHEAEWAEPSALDRYGMTLLAVAPGGVDTVRLAFPDPVDRLDDLRPGLGTVLRCRCGCRRDAAR
jgi:putative heme iron utilization protein